MLVLSKFSNLVSIRKQTIKWFGWFSVLLSCLYIVVSANFLYLFESLIINKQIHSEAQYMIKVYESAGFFPPPRQNFFSLHDNSLTMPDDMRQQYIDNPNKRDFYGDKGRHYHMVTFETSNGPTLLLGEFSQSLMLDDILDSLLMALIPIGIFIAIIMSLLACRIANRATKPLMNLAIEVDKFGYEKIPDDLSDKYNNAETKILAINLRNATVLINALLEREHEINRNASHQLVPASFNLQLAAKNLSKMDNLTDEQQVELIEINNAIAQIELATQTLSVLSEHPDFKEGIYAVEVLTVVEKAINQHEYLIKDKPIRVYVVVPENSKVWFEHSLVDAIIANLVSSAFRYTQQGKIIISFEDSTIAVFNTGELIPPGILNKNLDNHQINSTTQSFAISLSMLDRLCDHFDIRFNICNEHQGNKVSAILDFNHNYH